eukprot:8374642-Lingulodinium_polyedra.AAC.1
MLFGGPEAAEFAKTQYGKVVAKWGSGLGRANSWARAIVAARSALGLAGSVAIVTGPRRQRILREIAICG